MKNFTLITMCILSTVFTYGQQGGKILIAVLDNQKVPVENATVELLNSKDSALLKTSLSDKQGIAVFQDVAFNSYLIRVTSVGLMTTYSEPFSLDASNSSILLPSIKLSTKPASQMQNVTVSAAKPFIQKLNDRIVVNVGSSMVNAGSSAIEVLERAPGITIDQNDNISLRGKAGVIVMIDGKPTPMSGQDLANYLRSLPSSAIDRIDIITNPSAKYDAAGNAGIIDIRMKKDQRLGANGTVTAGFGQGVYPKTNAGTTFNYRNKKVNVFGNYNYGYRENLNHLIINRNFYDNGVFKGSDDKDNYAWMPFNSNTARIGADFFPSKKTIIGFVINGTSNAFRRNANITTIVNDTLRQPDYKFLSLGTNDDHFKNAVGNINFKHTFDSAGKELTADLDYGIFKSSSITRTASSFYNMDGSSRGADDILDGHQLGDLRFKTGKIDYVNPLGKGAKLEAGFKTSFVSSDNDAKFWQVLPAGPEVDSGKTNRFFYNENNNAAYVNVSKEYKKYNFQLGLRGEQTNLKTRQVQGDKHYGNNYFRLFPSAFFNYKLTEEQTLGVSISRRIDRPSYSQLNPFLFQIDPTIYGTGNPYLKPEMTWSYELSYTLKAMNFTLGYSHTTDVQNIVLSRIKDVIPDFVIKPGQSENITVQIPVNLSSSDYVGLTATAPVKVSKRWNMINNLNVYYNKFNGNLGGVALDKGAPSMSVRTNNNFNFDKGWAAEFTFNFIGGGQSGYMKTEPQWGLAFGGQKTVMKGKATIRANVTDLFWTNLPKATVTYEGKYVENWHAYRDTRVANLSFTYRFGNSKVQQARRRTTASEEERQRAGGN
ncbi:MAG: TonB-dependent receptor domain-containing protein [Flavisolibacter sp.]